MKVSYLYEAVSKLGFEDSLEDGKAFYYALNRATAQINALRPHVAIFDISKRPLANCISASDFAVREVFEKVEFSAIGARGYYFEALGEGKCEIFYEDNGKTKKMTNNFSKDSPFDTSLEKYGTFSTDKFTAFRGIITKEDGSYHEGEVKIVFSGEYVFSVRNVALYDRLLSSDPSKIPAFEPYTAYDMSSLVPDFIGFSENPVELEGYKILDKGYQIEGTRILLPYELTGVIRIKYRRSASQINYTTSPETDDTVIDLDEELCTLLPLLVSAYVWLDDEPEKAAQYYSLYSERTKEIVYNTKNIKPGVYATNGW